MITSIFFSKKNNLYWRIAAAVLGAISFFQYRYTMSGRDHRFCHKELILEKSRTELAKRNPDFLKNAQEFVLAESAIDSPRVAFLWRTADEKIFNSLVNKYICPNYWTVRYALFEGTQLERSEQYLLVYTSDGRLNKYAHYIADIEERPSLTEDDARTEAFRLIYEWYGTSAADIKEVTCSADKKLARTDWAFEFEDTTIHLPQGSPRIEVLFAGNELKQIARYIFVPEQWNRAYQQEGLYKRFCSAGISILFWIVLIMMVIYFKETISGVYKNSSLIYYTATAMAIYLAVDCIRLPQYLFGFITTTSLASNYVSLAIFLLCNALYNAPGLGILFFIIRDRVEGTFSFNRAITLALMMNVVAGFFALGALQYYPTVLAYGLSGVYYPILAMMLQLLKSFLVYVIPFCFITVGLNAITCHGKKYHLLIPFVYGAMTSLYFQTGMNLANLSYFIASCIAMTALWVFAYYCVIRHDLKSCAVGISIYLIIECLSCWGFFVNL